MPQYTKRKDGRYATRVKIGNRKYKLICANTQKELAKKVQEIQLANYRGINISAQGDTFEAWLKRWLENKELQVSEKRYKGYEYASKRLKEFYPVKITDIRTADVQHIINQNSKELSEYSLQKLRTIVKQVCQLAIDNRVMDYNPANSVFIPKNTKSSSSEERRALTEEEQSWIRNTEHSARRAAMIMMYAGLRRGEVIALMWSDVDLDTGTISVNKSAKTVDGKLISTPGGKTDAAVRTVYIPDCLINFLKNEERGNSLLVCPGKSGRMMTDSSWRRMWDSYLHCLNFEYGDFSCELNSEGKQYVKPKSRFSSKKIPYVIPRITPHWLRHTFITMMYLAGVDVLTAKEQAGHAAIQTTMSIYTHLDEQYKVKQINKLNSYLQNKIS